MGKKNKDKKTGITASDGTNTDGRKKYDWDTKYNDASRQKMFHESIYIGAVFVISLIFLIALWFLYGFCPCLEQFQFEKINILFYLFSGLLGGSVFGIKYFYRVIARGYWSLDRIYWRIFSPWISASIALIVGFMIISGFVCTVETNSPAKSICIGFVSGYFADDAVGKMSEVAKALFGRSEAKG